MATKPAVYRRPNLGLSNRRQVQLTDEMAEALRDVAQARDVSEAEVIRQALKSHLKILEVKGTGRLTGAAMVRPPKRQKSMNERKEVGA